MTTIPFVIPDEILSSLLEAFDREHPIRDIPVLDDNDEPVMIDGVPVTEPECTSIQNIKRYVSKCVAREVQAGATKIKMDDNPLNSSLIQMVIEANQD